MKKKIGFIDSGIGGLTLLKEAMDQKIDADFFYIGDSNNVPYGEKSQEFMLEKMHEMSLKLLEKKVDGIFVACNTATAQTIDKLRHSFPKTLFIGIEPYINYLNHSPVTKPHKIALILTQATYGSDRFKKLQKEYDKERLIDIYPLKKLALIIEKLENDKNSLDTLQKEISEELDFLKDSEHRYEYLILGCTHYPIIKSFIEKKYGLKCIDPAQQVVANLVTKLQLIESITSTGLFYSNFDNGNFWSENNIHNYKFL